MAGHKYAVLLIKGAEQDLQSLLARRLLGV